MKSDGHIYLGRNGQIFGPYSDTEFEKLKSTDEYKTYPWIWNGKTRGWDPTDAPPPPVEIESSITDTMGTDVQVVCHNFRQALTGRLEQITQIGGQIVANEGSDVPVFKPKASVVMNLLDPKSGKSVNVKAEIREVHRNGLIWTYVIQWKEIPEILAESPA